jgi:hypothetical protein
MCTAARRQSYDRPPRTVVTSLHVDVTAIERGERPVGEYAWRAATPARKLLRERRGAVCYGANQWPNQERGGPGPQPPPNSLFVWLGG